MPSTSTVAYRVTVRSSWVLVRTLMILTRSSAKTVLTSLSRSTRSHALTWTVTGKVASPWSPHADREAMLRPDEAPKKKRRSRSRGRKHAADVVEPLEATDAPDSVVSGG